MRKLQTLFVMILVSLAGSPAFAASGGSPNGKPFVEINDQLVAVQGDIDSIKDQIESLTRRVTSIEEESAVISEKLNQTIVVQTALSELVAQIEAGTTTLATAISDLQVESDSLAAQLAALGGSDEELQAQIDTNQTLILSLQVALTNGLDSVDNEIEQLNELAFYLGQEQSKIQAELDLKQSILDGSCEEGEVVTAVSQEGIQCQLVKSQTGITVFQVTKIDTVLGRNSYQSYTWQVNVECPINSIVIGVQVIANPSGLEVGQTRLSDSYNRFASIDFYRDYGKSHYVEVAAQCLKAESD